MRLLLSAPAKRCTAPSTLNLFPKTRAPSPPGGPHEPHAATTEIWAQGRWRDSGRMVSRSQGRLGGLGI